MMVLLWLAASRASAAVLLLSGTIGTAPIVMTLNLGSDDHFVDGNYFYRKHHVDIYVRGQQAADGSIALGEFPVGDDDIHVDMMIKPGSNGTWAGNWTGKNNKPPLTIKLALLASDRSTIAARQR